MKRYLLFIVFILIGIQFSFGQIDTLNQTNNKGNKAGWWVTLLDQNLKVTDDSSRATHCMYNYFVNGIHTYRFGEGYGSEKYPIIFPESDTVMIQGLNLLNGRYTTKYKNGNLRSEIITSNGFFTSFKKYHKNGSLAFEVIYSKECGAPKQHCIIEYKKNGSIKRESFTWQPNVK